ncbi:hepatoma-derived growth factor-related protein 2-like [Lineus longissimus]|uniref:hepatoma-derived growth factor-related protein 2-like n=1 Tax=Lineus longissimus TaxID=88925 RepID=UPI002B4D92DC
MAQVRVQHSPMYGQPQTQGPVPNRTGQKQSRLEMMQADYQKKILKEKEEKLIKMYEDNQKRAMERVNSRHGSGASGVSTASYGSTRSGYSSRSGSTVRRNNERQVVREADNVKSVREYFMEQRGQVGSGKTNSPANGITNGVNHKPPFPTAPVQHRAHQNRFQQANSAGQDGRDKSRPLEPISHPQKQKQRIEYNPDRYADIDDAPNPPIQMRAQLARPGKKPRGSDAGMNGHNTQNMQPELEVDSSIPDRTQLQRLRQQHQQKQAAQKPEGEKKMTDFQKWQMEQNATKEKRLQDFRRKQREPPASYRSDSEDEEEAERQAEIKRKERELLERIQQQKADLEHIRRERIEEEERERKERERDKKREEAAQRKREALAKARKASMDDSDNLDSHRSTYRKPPSRFEYEESDDERPPPQRVPQRPPAKPQSNPRQKKPAKPPQSNQAPKKWVPPASNFEDEPLPSKSTDNGVSFYAQAAKEAEKENLNLRPCPTCGRKFNVDRLDKHRKVCVESKKPRKTFDMSKKRVEGSEAEKYVRSVKKTDAYYSKKLKKTDWRKQHEGFIETVKYAKKMSDYEAGGGNILDLPPPPPSENPDYEQCPYCKRKFNQAAAERHIPKCKDTKNRPAPPKGKRR